MHGIITWLRTPLWGAPQWMWLLLVVGPALEWALGKFGSPRMKSGVAAVGNLLSVFARVMFGRFPVLGPALTKLFDAIVLPHVPKAKRAKAVPKTVDPEAVTKPEMPPIKDK